MKAHDYTIVITRDEDGMLIGHVPSLPGCHTQAKDYQTLLKRMKEAIQLYLEVQKDTRHEEFVGIQQLTVPA